MKFLGPISATATWSNTCLIIPLYPRKPTFERHRPLFDPFRPLYPQERTCPAVPPFVCF